MDNGRNNLHIEFNNLSEAALQKALQRLTREQVIRRIWDHDHTVWSDCPAEISNRLGWLYSHKSIAENIESIYEFVEQIRVEGYTKALLLGMGGSSLAPEVFRKVFGVQDGYLDLDVLDSTDPGAILEKERAIETHKTLFIVSTKSGGTVETLSLMKHFYNKTILASGQEKAGRHFIAITDPGSSLEKSAEELRFRKTFLNDPDIGGRYSALSYFGLVPAALIGINLQRLLHNAATMAIAAYSFNRPLKESNSPAWLGAALGDLALSGRDKVTFISSPPIKPFGTWIEQLVAESTGKEGKGLVPVNGEPLAAPEIYTNDRLFVYFRLFGDTTYDQDLNRLKTAGHPLIQLNLQNEYDLGGEFFRWMMATAITGWFLGVNPFDQPNVESAKALTNKMVAVYQDKGKLPSLNPDLEVKGIKAYSEHRADNLQQLWRDFLKQAKPGENEGKGRSYIAIQAYLPPDPETDQALQGLRDKLQTSYRMASTVGYGPRFLHSTGQLHKGDAGNGLFIQLTAEAAEDLPIPDQPGSNSSTISFNTLKNAQVLGDRQALLNAGRKVISFHFNKDIKKAIARLSEALEKQN